jgi:hypothetical protein
MRYKIRFGVETKLSSERNITHITLCHAEYKLATSNVTSYLAIPGTDYFSDKQSTGQQDTKA